MEIEDLSLDLAGDIVPWRIFSPAKATKEYCVLWLQGWTSTMDSHREGVERMSKQASTTFVTLDPAGHGLHALPLDESTREQQLGEIVAVYDELKKRDYKKIIVIGVSFGGYMAALLTGKRPLHSAILRAPANYPDDEFARKYKETLRTKDYAAYAKPKESDEMLKENMATEAIKKFDKFVYILVHELDEVVPEKVPRNYFNVARHGNYIIIPKTKHSPKLMKNPQLHFKYIENIIIAIIQAIKHQDELDAN